MARQQIRHQNFIREPPRMGGITGIRSRIKRLEIIPQKQLFPQSRAKIHATTLSAPGNLLKEFWPDIRHALLRQ